jgi:hypothetical protein
MDDKKTPEGYKFYEKVAADAGANITFAFIGAGVIWLIGRWFSTAARVLFWIDAALMAWTIVHFVVVTVAGVIVSAPGPISGQPPRRWLWAAQAARFVELILCLAALWLAARAVGYYK